MIDWILNQFLKFGINFVIWYVNGLLVVKKEIKTNYTRKINHFSLLFLPFFFNMIAPPKPPNDQSSGHVNDFVLTTLSILSGLLYLVIFIKPIRERVSVVNTAFLSIDRPEDRPYTLLWISTQTAAGFFAAIPLTAYLMMINKMELIFIVIVINGIGDGLAEPIGVRFGKHKYETYALFTKKKYVRSVEGSACVFVTALLIIVFFRFSFSPIQFIVALIAIPILMTIAEAISPHSWDNPFLFLVGSILLFLILQFMV